MYRFDYADLFPDWRPEGGGQTNACASGVADENPKLKDLLWEVGITLALAILAAFFGWVFGP
jgi:hypothetical protein